jgi:hypothetical protein
MKKSAELSSKLSQAEALIERAKSLVEQVLVQDTDRNGDSGLLFMDAADSALDLINDLGYEIIMPIEMEEEEAERLAEIARLEARLEELRSFG